MKEYPWIAYRIGKLIFDFIYGLILSLMMLNLTSNPYITFVALFLPRIRSIILAKVRREIPGRKRHKLPIITCEGKIVRKALYTDNLSGLDRFFERTHIEIETSDGENVRIYITFANSRMHNNLEMFNVGEVVVVHYREYKGFKHFERFDEIEGVEYAGPSNPTAIKWFGYGWIHRFR